MSLGWFAFAVLLPLWALGGLGDYLCHRAARNSATSVGVRESLLHLLQWTQIVLPVLLVLGFGLRPWTLAAGAACVLAHSLTAWWDERCARPGRYISIAENHCHAFLISLPVVAWALALWLYADAGSAAPAAPGWAVAVVVLVFLVSGGFVLEELLRCLRERRTRAA
ncbi:hypothetical protein [Tahibacter harae]|uniref:Diguanylate cyclase n=1 Tax=Tahibacter harae TaxID=2963937 RepID=A0ABT1QMZ4_9GAMM|nr:hypothetical protein [Tahibacter harae]MCQ4163263.1 hypothetical protein [Tahibacter harae]